MLPTKTCAQLLLLPLVLFGAPGCSQPSDEEPRFDPRSQTLVPAGGKITLNGKPLVMAVVSFRPPRGATSVGETDAKGQYALKTLGRVGVPVGEYKVAISYLLSPEGEPLGAKERFRMLQPAGTTPPKEQLPPDISDLSRTRLEANVTKEGRGRFDFEIEATLPPPDEKPQSQGPAGEK